MAKYQHKIYKEFTDKGILAIIPSLNKLFLFGSNVDVPDTVLSEKRNIEFLPSDSMQLVLILTNNCNLACNYCYEYTSRRDLSIMSYDLITAAMTYIFDTAANNKVKLVKIALFGGEPTLSWDKLAYSLAESRRLATAYSIRQRLSLVTNGHINGPLDQIIDSIDHLAVSVDGPPDIQDTLRPTRSGGRSSDKVFQTIDYLYQSAKQKLSFRITITPATIGRIKEIASFFDAHYSGVPQSYEPLMPTDRNKARISVVSFLDHFLSILKERSFNNIRSSMFSLKPSLSFCGMERRLVIYPDGSITGCHRINSENPGDQIQKYFAFGQIENNKVLLSKEGLENATNLSLAGTLGKNCKECFAKYYCRGGCAALKLGFGIEPFNRLPWCEKVRHFYVDYFLHKLTAQGFSAN